MSDEKFSEGIEYTVADGQASITKYSGSDKTLIIPKTLGGYEVTSIGDGAFACFACCGGLASIEIPNSVTSIGNGAFYGCTGLSSIEIPDSVTSIENGAFQGCSSLTSIEIPHSVSSIGDWAFYGCESLTSIKIPNSVTCIGDHALGGCESLTSIKIPDSLTSIEWGIFQGCSSLTSIEIPNSVTCIGNGAFEDCTSLTMIHLSKNHPVYSFVGGVLFDKKQKLLHAYLISNKETSYAIPDSVTSIGDWAFYNCGSLTSIEIPNSVTSIGNGAFRGCTSLTSIEIPDSVTYIGNGAFYKCTNLASIEIPDSVTSIGNGAFAQCTSLTLIRLGKNHPVYTFISGVLFDKKQKSLHTYLISNKETFYVIPDSVTSIGEWAFRDCTSLTTIEFSDTVTSIDNGAFWGCTSLSSIEIPDSITSIGGSAFGGCTGLSSIEIPDSVTSIENGAFQGCSSLTSIEIPHSVSSIGDWAFYGCESLTTIKIPNSVTCIGDSVFKGCTSLTGIEISDTVISVGNRAFGDCTSLADIAIPDSVTSIGDSAFGGCTSLTMIEIPDSVTSIGERAFWGCKGLTTIKIPDSVTCIGDGVFDGCNSLTCSESDFTYTVEDGYATLTSYEGSEVFVLIPETLGGYFVTSIGDGAFENCSSLTDVMFHSSVTSIGKRAFEVGQRAFTLTEVTKVTGVNAVHVVAETSELVGKVLEIIEELYANKQAYYTGIPSGFDSLDCMTRGFKPSEIIIIGARPSMGKTAMALSMLQHISIEKKIPAAFFSLEMSNIQIMQRLLSQESRINAQRLRTGYLKNDDFPHLLHAADRLYQAPIFIVESFNIKLHDLLATARRLRAQNKIEIIFIDDITYIQSENTFIPRHEQITEISRSLKKLSRELKIPIVILSPLRRDEEQKEPTLADIPEFDFIEQYVDIVMFIHRERKTSKIESVSLPLEAKLILAKQRNGPVGFVEVEFIPRYTKFENKKWHF